MPEICRFYGIVIKMFFDDPNPPHFHAEYGEYKICVEIHSGIIQGQLSQTRAQVAIGVVRTLSRPTYCRLATSGATSTSESNTTAGIIDDA